MIDNKKVQTVMRIFSLPRIWATEILENFQHWTGWPVEERTNFFCGENGAIYWIQNIVHFLFIKRFLSLLTNFCCCDTLPCLYLDIAHCWICNSLLFAKRALLLITCEHFSIPWENKWAARSLESSKGIWPGRCSLPVCQ